MSEQLRVLIDPPVGPFSSKGAIEVWAEEVEKHVEEAEDPVIRQAWEDELERVRRWLSWLEVADD